MTIHKKSSLLNFETCYIVFLKSLMRKKGLWIILGIMISATIIFQVITGFSEINSVMKGWSLATFQSLVEGSQGPQTDSVFLEESFGLLFTSGHINFAGRGGLISGSGFTVLGLYIAFVSFVSKRNKGSLLVFLSTSTNKTRILWANILAMFTVIFLFGIIYTSFESILTRELYLSFTNGSEVSSKISTNFDTQFIRFSNIETGSLAFDSEIPKSPGVIEWESQLNMVAKNHIETINSVENTMKMFAVNLGLYLTAIIYMMALSLILSSFLGIMTVSILVIGLVTALSLMTPILGILDLGSKREILTALKLIMPINAIEDLKVSLYLDIGGKLNSTNEAAQTIASARFPARGNAVLEDWVSESFWTDVSITGSVFAFSPVLFILAKQEINRRGDWK